jgi:hypothetical protein
MHTGCTSVQRMCIRCASLVHPLYTRLGRLGRGLASWRCRGWSPGGDSRPVPLPCAANALDLEAAIEVPAVPGDASGDLAGEEPALLPGLAGLAYAKGMVEAGFWVERGGAREVLAGARLVPHRPGIAPPSPLKLPTRKWRNLILRGWQVDPLCAVRGSRTTEKGSESGRVGIWPCPPATTRLYFPRLC